MAVVTVYECVACGGRAARVDDIRHGTGCEGGETRTHEWELPDEPSPPLFHDG